MLVATRTLTVRGRTYAAGETVEDTALPPGKAEQLVGQRLVRDTTATLAPTFRATRTFACGAQHFRRGDLVPSAGLRPDKVAQLLEQRYLEPLGVDRARRVRA